MAENFLAYKPRHLTKINAMRRAASQPTFDCVPVLTKGQVLFVSAGQMQDEPATCYNCHFFNYGRSCMLIGERVRIRKFVYPEHPTADAKRIEYWPCCGMWDKGTPNYGAQEFHAANDPSNLGLIWINAPEVGQTMGGANCGGQRGGDDCDHYITQGDDKRSEPTAFCRVLQATVENGAVCAAWSDDDQISFQKAQDILRELG